MASSMSRFLTAGLLGFGLALLAGCSGGGNAKGSNVEGKVTVGGAAANAGEVVFNVDGTTVVGAISADGTYRAIGVPVGNAKVTVNPPPAVSGAPKGGDPRLAVDKKDMPGAVGAVVAIPSKYSKAETSGLTFTVKSGANTYNIELTN